MRRRLVVDFGRVCERRKLKMNVDMSMVMRCSRDGIASWMDMSISGEILAKVIVFRSLG